MIRVAELRAGYRSGFRRSWKEILSGISFHVPAGSITGYLGINGAGKTTTIKVLVGINAPSGGGGTIGGHPLGSREAQQLVGYFPEAPFFYDGLSARELLGFYGRLSGVPRDTLASRTDQLMQEVGLEDAGDTPVRGFSKGMRQRLGLAQALIHDPACLILDEPLDGLDPMGRLQLRGLINRQRERGRTVFFSSHVLSDVEAVSDHLVVLDGGKIAYDGATNAFAAAEERIEIRFSASEETLAAVVAAAGAEATVVAGGHEVLCDTSAAADQVVDLVREGEGRIIALASRRANLEAAFLLRFGPTAPAASATESA